jgi:hypothetical protein
MQASLAAPSPPEHAYLRHRPDTNDTPMHERTTTPSSIRFCSISDRAPATTTWETANDIDDEVNTQQSIDLLHNDDQHDQYIEGLSQDSDRLQIPNAPKKRSRRESELSTATHTTARTFTYIIFNVEMATTETDIMDDLLPAFGCANIPTTAYDSSLRFHGFPSIYNLVEKHAILKCLNLSLTDSIIQAISESLHTSYAYTTDHPPPAPIPEDIDMLPLYNPLRYCQVTSCTYHHNRRDVFPNTPHMASTPQKLMVSTCTMHYIPPSQPPSSPPLGGCDAATSAPPSTSTRSSCLSISPAASPTPTHGHSAAQRRATTTTSEQDASPPFTSSAPHTAHANSTN